MQQYSLLNPLPGWIYRLESDWLMHEEFPLAICRNDGRSPEYRWELWKCFDLMHGQSDDRILGHYPTCVDAMVAVEEWRLILYPFAVYKEPIPEISRWQRLGLFIHKLKRLR